MRSRVHIDVAITSFDLRRRLVGQDIVCEGPSGRNLPDVKVRLAGDLHNELERPRGCLQWEVEKDENPSDDSSYCNRGGRRKKSNTHDRASHRRRVNTCTHPRAYLSDSTLHRDTIGRGRVAADHFGGSPLALEDQACGSDPRDEGNDSRVHHFSLAVSWGE